MHVLHFCSNAKTLVFIQSLSCCSHSSFKPLAHLMEGKSASTNLRRKLACMCVCLSEYVYACPCSSGPSGALE